MKWISSAIPKIHHIKLDIIERESSTILRKNPCFIYFTTNSVFVPSKSGIKKRNAPSAAPSFSWLDTLEVGVSIREKKRDKERWCRGYASAGAVVSGVSTDDHFFGASFSVREPPTGFLSSVFRVLIELFTSPRINASDLIELTLHGTK